MILRLAISDKIERSFSRDMCQQGMQQVCSFHLMDNLYVLEMLMVGYGFGTGRLPRIIGQFRHIKQLLLMQHGILSSLPEQPLHHGMELSNIGIDCYSFYCNDNITNDSVNNVANTTTNNDNNIISYLLVFLY